MTEDSIDIEDETELLKTLVQEVPYRGLIFLSKLNGSYASEISSKADTTYSHAVKMMNRFEDQGLVVSEKKGRKKEYELTEEGSKIAEKLIELDELVGPTVGGELSTGRSVREIVNESAS